jgi:hypothetical protein
MAIIGDERRSRKPSAAVLQDLFWCQRVFAGWQRGGDVVDDTTSVLRSSGVSVCKLLRAPAWNPAGASFIEESII